MENYLEPSLLINMEFRLFLEQSNITVYHGSRNSSLTRLDAKTPPYEGGLGTGVYVGLHPSTAEFYNRYVYELRTTFNWNSVFVINENTYYENWWHIEGADGYSILVGEHVPPFFVKIKNHLYAVTNGKEFSFKETAEEIDLDNIGELVQKAGYKAIYASGLRFNSSVNEEMLVFDPNDLIMVRQIK